MVTHLIKSNNIFLLLALIATFSIRQRRARRRWHDLPQQEWPAKQEHYKKRGKVVAGVDGDSPAGYFRYDFLHGRGQAEGGEDANV